MEGLTCNEFIEGLTEIARAGGVTAEQAGIAAQRVYEMLFNRRNTTFMSKDRYTEKSPTGKWRVEISATERNAYQYEHSIVAPDPLSHEYFYGPAIDRLAAYEDTGLMPGEIEELLHDSTGPLHKKLGQWIDADREGRLTTLPCNIGDPVFYLTGAPAMAGNYKISSVEKSRCMGFYFDEKGLQIRLDYDWKGGHGTYGYFGKTVFASLDDATAALKGETDGKV